MSKRFSDDARPIKWRDSERYAYIILIYDDGDTVNVSREDFQRAFGTIINLTKAECKAEFAA